MEKTPEQRLTELESKVRRLEQIIEESNVTTNQQSNTEFNSMKLFSSFFESISQLSKSLLRVSGLIHIISKEKFSLPNEVQSSLYSKVDIISFDYIQLKTKTSIPKFELEDVNFEKLNFPINRILLNLDYNTRKIGDILKQQQEILREELSQIAPDIRRQANANIRFKHNNNGESTSNNISS